MNILTVVIAHGDQAAAGLESRFQKSMGVAAAASGEELTSFASRRTEAVSVYCSQPASPVWKEGPWVTHNEELVAFSMPPAPMTGTLNGGSWGTYVRQNVLEAFNPSDFAPNYFGCRVRGSEVDIWTDHLGMGRCYTVSNSMYSAFSNHIGALVPFLLEKPTVDDTALARFVAFGWYTEDSTPITEVKRVPAAQVISFANEKVETSTYLDLEELYAGDGEPDFSGAAAEMMNLNSNLSQMANIAPTIFLSGGRDSRMTCGTWIGGGGEGSVVTYGDLENEAAIASELMSIFDSTRRAPAQQVTHDVRTRPASGSKELRSLSHRIGTAFTMWDGDAAPVKLRGNVGPSRARRFSVSGIGGEITHGYFYGKPGMIDRIRALPGPLDRLQQVFQRKNYLADFAFDALDGFFESKANKYRSIGLSDFRLLDYFYLEEKLRRWAPQTTNTISPVPLCTIGYQRLAFRLSLDQQIDVEAPLRIADAAIPGWGSVRTYKASPEDASRAAVKSARVWNTDPEEFHSYFDSEGEWAAFINPSTIAEALRRIETGEMSEMYESWLLRAIWISETYRHVRKLGNLVE